MATWLLDTNICVHILRKKPAHVRERMAAHALSDLAISVITWGELRFGAERSASPGRATDQLQAFADLVRIEPLPPDAGAHYGAIRATLAVVGLPIGANDLWIAAHALAAGHTVVTNNEREFLRVPGLKVENWV